MEGRGARNSTESVKVLIVDDSAFMRKALSMMLESDPDIKVIGTARDGEEGVEKVKRLKPDLVTMDIEMPRMDGLAALRRIMKENPVPVMMISSLTSEGAQATLDALEIGAVDFIPKQLSYVSLDIVKIKDELLAKIKHIARRRHVLMARLRFKSSRQLGHSSESSGSRTSGGQISSPAIVKKRHHQVSIIAIGSSTGGPPALQAVIPRLPRNLPVGIVIAQHMPPKFTASLAERLDQLSALTVREASDGDPVEAGVVYIAPGGFQMTVKKYGGRARVVVSTEPTEALYKPCVDVLMNSVADQYLGATMGVMLTGMGNNGVIGAKNLKARGGVLIAQDEATCVVYGMPRAVAEAKLVDHIAPIEQIATEVVSFF
ncbi:MAG: chemotaxis response regulator protein-glutamate methylesterase [Candidatus Zixiibacteriota bacterium]